MLADGDPAWLVAWRDRDRQTSCPQRLLFVMRRCCFLNDFSSEVFVDAALPSVIFNDGSRLYDVVRIQGGICVC